MQNSFLERARMQNGTVILMQGGRDETGQNAWYFLRVENAKLQLFKRVVKEGDVNMERYGEVLASGYGTTPPDHIIERMRHHCGYTGEHA